MVIIFYSLNRCGNHLPELKLRGNHLPGLKLRGNLFGRIKKCGGNHYFGGLLL